MRTVFALFNGFTDASVAVERLHHEDGVDLRDMNMIVHADVAKAGLQAMTASIGAGGAAQDAGTPSDIEALLSSRQPMKVAGLGSVYLVGREALIVGKAAQTSSIAEGGPNNALADWVPRDVADAYVAGIVSGGVLLWVRTADALAPQVANTMRSQKGREITSRQA